MEPAAPSFLALLSGLAQFWLAPILAVGVSVVYFLSSPKSQSVGGRVAASVHGSSIALLYFAAIAVHQAGIAQPKYGTVFASLLLLPIALAFGSFFVYRGRKAVHMLQLLNVLCLAWTFFIGSMAVTGTWL